MSFRKKLSIVAMIGSFLSGNFVNASECTKNVWITIGNRSIRVGEDWYNMVVSQGLHNAFTWAPDEEDGSIPDSKIYFLTSEANHISENVNNVEDKEKTFEIKEIVPENKFTETKFNLLLNGLNLSKSQMDVAKKIKFNKNLTLNTKYHKWCQEKKLKLCFDISLSEINNEIEIKTYYYNANESLKKNINIFMQNEKNKAFTLNHFKKFVSLVNDYDAPNCASKSPLSFTKLLRFRMVIDNKCNSCGYIALKDKDGKWRELDYSKYSNNDLLDLCKYFVYCIPSCVFSN